MDGVPFNTPFQPGHGSAALKSFVCRELRSTAGRNALQVQLDALGEMVGVSDFSPVLLVDLPPGPLVTEDMCGNLTQGVAGLDPVPFAGADFRGLGWNSDWGGGRGAQRFGVR